jgi:hypothetical protein
MITATIGRMLLDAYNEREGTKYDARTFFIEEFCPLFFDHNKYMMTAGNSPLENPKISWADMIAGKKEWETPQKRKDRFDKLMEKIDSGLNDASVARGFPITDVEGSTSGQVTDLSLPLTSENVMLSWMGDALGIGVQGGLSILFFNKSIMLDIFDGWKYYRQELEGNNRLKGNQINTWNGQWLTHYYDTYSYVPSNPIAGFSPFDASKSGAISMVPQSWTKALIAISKKYKELQVLGYVYSIGQMNTTIGFIPFSLAQIRRPVRLYAKYFSASKQEAEPLWGTGLGFKRACENGIIGVEAMKPKGLEKYMGQGDNMPKPAKKQEQQINYNVYQIWLLAMLNNDELWDKSHELAQLLLQASVNKDKKISPKSGNLVKNVLHSVNKKQFVEACTEIMPNVSDGNLLNKMVQAVHQMPNDNVPYFLALVRFQYVTLEKLNNK